MMWAGRSACWGPDPRRWWMMPVIPMMFLRGWLVEPVWSSTCALVAFVWRRAWDMPCPSSAA
eukprot:2662152-Prorocentrum_lima.AAC.1